LVCCYCYYFFQLKALKVILGCSSKTSDIAVRMELGVMKLETRRKVAMLKWLGQINRIPSIRLVKYVFDNLDYKWQSRGRARRRTWKRNVEIILDELI